MQKQNETKKGEQTMKGKYLSPKEHTHYHIPQDFLEDDNHWKILTTAQKASLTEAQLYAYERFWDAINVENALAEGKYKRGREEGREEGRDERSLEIARGMKQKGLGEDLIAELTGLSVDEIETL